MKVTEDALRSLVNVPVWLVPQIVEHYRESEDEQVLLGLFDLLLGHATRDEWLGEIESFLRTTILFVLYAILAMQIVASRSEVLITMLRDLATSERDSEKKPLLDHALEWA